MPLLIDDQFIDGTAVKSVDFLCWNNTFANLKLRHQGLIIIGAALGLDCGFGPIVVGAAGIFLKPIANFFNWIYAEVAFLPMLGMVGLAKSAPIAAGAMREAMDWRQAYAWSPSLTPQQD